MITVRDIARLAGLDPEGRIEDVAIRIVCAVRGRPILPPVDYYAPAAAVLGVDRELLLRSRAARPLAGRWGVWLALSGLGWSSVAIARGSCPGRVWDHSTVLNALRRAPASSEPIRGWIAASRAAVEESLKTGLEGLQVGPRAESAGG